MRRLHITVAALALVLSASPVASTAQAQERPNPSRVFSINPFILLLGHVSAEFEQRVTPSHAVAIAGSYTDFDDNRYTNLDIKGRLYPNERALNGFGLAASGGVTWVRARDHGMFICDPDCREEPGTVRSYSSPTVALEISYQWLLGTQRSTSINLAGGLKRLLAGERTLGGDTRFLPTGRVNIGYAF